MCFFSVLTGSAIICSPLAKVDWDLRFLWRFYQWKGTWISCSEVSPLESKAKLTFLLFFCFAFEMWSVSSFEVTEGRNIVQTKHPNPLIHTFIFQSQFIRASRVTSETSQFLFQIMKPSQGPKIHVLKEPAWREKSLPLLPSRLLSSMQRSKFKGTNPVNIFPPLPFTGHLSNYLSVERNIILPVLYSTLKYILH